MNKLTLTISALIIFLVMGIVLTLISQNSTESGQSSENPLRPVQTENSISIPTQRETVVLDNFTKNPSVTEDEQNPDLYYLGNTFKDDSADVSPPYVIIYDSSTGFINVAILEQPFAVSQYQAEAYLKNLLQLSQAELCSLPHSVSVPGYISDVASGIDYRFSFCADALLIPNI